MTKQQQRYRNICFTNFDLKFNYKILEEISTYFIYGLETCPTTKREHHQGYAQLEKQLAFNTLIKLLPGFHIEARRGSIEQAITYCKKEGKVTEYGVIPQPGKRSDLTEAINMIREEGVMSSIETYPEVWSRTTRGLLFVANKLYKPPKWTEMYNTVLYGKPGTGKTRKAYLMDENLYQLPIQSKGTLWFDEYGDEETILFDDFYGSVEYETMLRLLDGYPIMVPIKGGFAHKKWNKVIITSNSHPSEWYNRPEWEALRRRLNSIILIEDSTQNSEVRGNTSTHYLS